MLLKINPLYFIVSFAVGLLFVYILKPPPEIVIKFPSPQNAGKIVYKTENDTCFTILASKDNCPTDKTLIKPQPIA